MLRETKVNGIKLGLAVENGGNPFWLIAARGVKPNAEVWEAIYDDRVAAEQAFAALHYNFLLEELQQVFGNDQVFVSVLKLLQKYHFEGVTAKSLLAEAHAAVVN